jgi:hypothetical protein
MNLKSTVVAGFLVSAVLILTGPAELAAQFTVDSSRQPTISPVPQALVGTWRWDTKRQSCGSVLDSYGDPIKLGEGVLCQWPMDQIEKKLNGRGRAWVKMFSADEAMSPKWSCGGNGLGTDLTEGYLRTFAKRPEAFIMYWEHSQRTRYIYTDGRPHAPAMELFYHGDSIGWMEGETFVVETTNMTFNTDGYDDLSHLATSHLAKFTERYTMKDYENIELSITVEDPLFLTEPFTFVGNLRRTSQVPANTWDCDPKVPGRELYETFRNPYPDDTTGPKYFGID